MFSGTYTPKLDDKGRLFLPAKFREALAEGLWVARGQERCLTIYTNEGFEQLSSRLQEASKTNAGIRNFIRMLFSGASQESPDKQGRITIPQTLRDYAGLRRDVVVIGSMDRIEIWNPTSWEEYSAEQEAAFAELTEELVPGV